MTAKTRKQNRRRKPKAGRAASEGRGSEIFGVIGIGISVFVTLSLLSLQMGDGALMGPFGRACAKLVYGIFGLGSYLFIAGASLLCVRVLLDRKPVARPMPVLGAALGLTSLIVLLHLLFADYQVAGLGAGGALGKGVAELFRSVVSTAGTALVATVGLVVAVVISTPLRMQQVLSYLVTTGKKICVSAAVGVKRVGSDAAHFGGEVIRAILPERERDEYSDEYEDEEEEDYDEEAEIEASAAAVDPPIFDASGRVETEATGGDTIKNEAAVIEETAEEEKPAKKRKSKARKPKKTKIGLGEGAADAEAGTVDEPVAEEVTADADDEDPTKEPMIVESKFKAAGAEEMKKKEAEADGERLDFIPLQKGEYKLPPVSLLQYDENQGDSLDRAAMLEMSARLTQTLENYGVKGEVAAIRPGPVVTMYEFAPAPGTRLNKIVNLSDDLAMSLEALKVRIVAPIPGKAAVGIEVPNKRRETVFLKEIIADETFRSPKLKLPMALGKDIEGAPQTVDLAKMPHLLVAGTTGSGKSVSVNSMISSLLYSCTPEQVRLIMVDPKMLELSIYEGVPHLLLPVVTDPKKANIALRWAVDEMERRYDLLAKMGVRDISNYNKKVEKLQAEWKADALERAAEEARRVAEGDYEDDEQVESTEIRGADEERPRNLPFIVIVIDEFADLMMCAPKDVETSVARIAQKARAAGIHLLLATQRPSVDVITGLIKANFPSRIAFRVTSKVDSRTILDQGGAEALLGSGDMLFSDRGSSPRRLHGCFVDEEEIHRVVEFLKTQGKPIYNMDILKPREDEEDADGAGGDDPPDEMYDKAVQVVAESQRVSVSYLQRRLSVGYNRAAKMVERMERDGVVSAPDNKKQREVLVSAA